MRFDSAIVQLLRKFQRSSIILSGSVEFAKKYVTVAEVRVRSSFSSTVTELSGELQSLLMEGDGFAKVSQKIVCVPEIPVSATLCDPIRESQHKIKVPPAIGMVGS